MASVAASSSPITQVSQHQAPAHANLQPQLLTRLQLDLRGERFSVDRETIMNLPESVLLCLFPNGLVLSRQSVALSDGGENEEDEEIYGVDVRLLFMFQRDKSASIALMHSPRNMQNIIQHYFTLYSSTQDVFHTF